MNGILFSVIVENITTRKDNTLKVVLGSQELSSGKMGELFAYMNKLSAVYLSPKEIISQKEIDQIDQIEADIPGKTQSQRIRNTLFILFTQDKEGFQTFDSYYKNKTELYINHLKNKIQ